MSPDVKNCPKWSSNDPLLPLSPHRNPIRKFNIGNLVYDPVDPRRVGEIKRLIGGVTRHDQMGQRPL